MTSEEFQRIREFVGQLPGLRIQLADGPLLDRCQQALTTLIEAYQSEMEENETRYPEPAHIEDVPRAEAQPQAPPEPPIPPQLHRQPGPPPQPEPEHHKKKASHHFRKR